MAVSFDNIRQSLQGVQTVLVSDIQPDPNSDYYVRYVEFYTDPPGVPNRSPIIHVTLYGGSQQAGAKGNLEIQIPSGLLF
jgi:hypothetical protein